MSKICNRCGVDKELVAYSPFKRGSQGVHGTCKACRNVEAGAKYREANPKKHGPRRSSYSYTRGWRARNPEQARANDLVAKHLKRGSLVAGPCARCGKAGKVQAHHEDYSRPLDIVWLCYECHLEVHH